MQTVSALTPRVSNNIADMPHDSVANGPVDFDFDAADEETSLCICVCVCLLLALTHCQTMLVRSAGAAASCQGHIIKELSERPFAVPADRLTAN